MRKITMFIMAMTVIAFVYMSADVLAEGMMGESHEDVNLWIGKAVMNTQGDKLGTVKDFVTDSDGKISFALVSHGGFLGFGEREVAVPYSALSYNKEKEYFTCDISADRFANAPEFKDEATLHDRSVAEEIYRYFGQQPYWSEHSGEKPMGMEKSMEKGSSY
jgi:sporulation protein YlmC with PRC-barrel domain